MPNNCAICGTKGNRQYKGDSNQGASPTPEQKGYRKAKSNVLVRTRPSIAVANKAVPSGGISRVSRHPISVGRDDECLQVDQIGHHLLIRNLYKQFDRSRRDDNTTCFQ
jgi:hypothetical protein